MKLGEKINFIRKKNGMSQEDLANKLDVSRQTVYKWETDNATPELDKIKAIASLFNVSFDYLINDEIEKNDNLEETCEMKKERRVFVTGFPTNHNQVEIDNGYIKDRETKKSKKGHLEERRSVAEKTLKEFGATEITFVQDYTATAFFYDKIKKVVGFYYAGRIQLVCPVESICEFRFGGGETKLVNNRTMLSGAMVGTHGSFGGFGGSIPTVSAVRDSQAWCVLTYKDGDAISSFEMKFNTYNRLFFNYEIYGTNNIMDFTISSTENLIKNLNMIKISIDSLKGVGNNILNGTVKVEEVDYEQLEAKNEESAKEYEQYKQRVAEETKSDNKRALKRKLIIAGSLILGVVVAAVVVVAVCLA